MLHYEKLSSQLEEKIKIDIESCNAPRLAFDESEVVRRNTERDTANIWRTAFIRDIDK